MAHDSSHQSGRIAFWTKSFLNPARESRWNRAVAVCAAKKLLSFVLALLCAQQTFDSKLVLTGELPAVQRGQVESGLLSLWYRTTLTDQVNGSVQLWNTWAKKYRPGGFPLFS